jgi:hypothetical protein
MKLSSIIDYRNLLARLDPADTDLLINSHLGPVLYSIGASVVQFPDLLEQLNRDRDQIHGAFMKFRSTVREIREQLQGLIDQLEPTYFTNSFELYKSSQHVDNPEYLLNRHPDLSQDAVDYIRSRLRLLSDWHHPAMVIRPGQADWIEDLVGSDPLYLVDYCEEMIRPTLNRFREEYQRRLQVYIEPRDGDSIVLESLPQSQFGLVVALYYFNFMPMERVGQYLTEIFNKLKPGGSLLMTFNDCDIGGGVELAERSYMCYTPGHMIKTLAKTLGFEITQWYYLEKANALVELRRPGRLTSLRGGQSLGKIIPKPVVNSK